MKERSDEKKRVCFTKIVNEMHRGPQMGEFARFPVTG